MVSFSEYCNIFIDCLAIESINNNLYAVHVFDKYSLSNDENVLDALLEHYKFSVLHNHLHTHPDLIRSIPTIDNLIKAVVPFVPDESLVNRAMNNVFGRLTRIEQVAWSMFSWLIEHTRSTKISSKIGTDIFVECCLDPFFIDPLTRIIIGEGSMSDFINISDFLAIQWNISGTSQIICPFSNFCIHSFSEFRNLPVSVF